MSIHLEGRRGFIVIYEEQLGLPLGVIYFILLMMIVRSFARYSQRKDHLYLTIQYCWACFTLLMHTIFGFVVGSESMQSPTSYVFDGLFIWGLFGLASHMLYRLIHFSTKFSPKEQSSIKKLIMLLTATVAICMTVEYTVPLKEFKFLHLVVYGSFGIVLNIFVYTMTTGKWCSNSIAPTEQKIPHYNTISEGGWKQLVRGTKVVMGTLFVILLYHLILAWILVPLGLVYPLAFIYDILMQTLFIILYIGVFYTFKPMHSSWSYYVSCSLEPLETPREPPRPAPRVVPAPAANATSENQDAQEVTQQEELNTIAATE